MMMCMISSFGVLGTRWKIPSPAGVDAWDYDLGYVSDAQKRVEDDETGDSLPGLLERNEFFFPA